MKLSLGIDTSNYTTSLCVVAETGEIVFDRRKILKVAPGARGLRQSEALFQHVQNLPELTEELGSVLQGNELVAIVVSTRPRPKDDSYMPVFLPGTSLANSLANVLQVPLYEISHQEAHIWAGLGNARGAIQFPFVSIHLSGGTTEMALIKEGKAPHTMAIELLGGTLDLHAGQFVDRLGVALGLPFPAGPSLEKLALKANDSLSVPTFQREGNISFSGPLTALEKLLGIKGADVLAASCLSAISRTLIKWIRWAEKQTTCRQILVVGGVAANKLIRAELERSLPHWNLFYAEPNFSVDNAYGPAYFGAIVSGLL